MYSITDDRVVALGDAPSPSVGAPLPIVLADEGSLLLAYIVHDPDPDWDGTYVTVVGPDTEEQPVAVVRFFRPYCHLLGPPNDEAFAGHPLASRGLLPYSVSEVVNSSWIRSLERMNSVHPYHSPALFERYRHYIFAFHDSTFECIAEGFQSNLHRCSMQAALQLMVRSFTSTQ